ncbi:MAG: FecR domain-containing protein [Marinoscillum sp.]
MTTELLQRFFNNTCTEKEAHEVLVWINSQEGENELAQMFESFDESDIMEQDPLQSNHLREKLGTRLKEHLLVKKVSTDLSLEENVKLTASRGSKTIKYFARIAAVLLLATSLSLIYVYQLTTDRFATGTSQMVTRSTESGQKLTIHLADGSLAILNANSSVTYPKEFSSSVRPVQMQGEVFFEVAEDKNKPFIVHTSQMSTTALGTSFIVNAYSVEEQTVSLVTGKVKVELKDQEKVEYLLPGDEIHYNNKQSVVRSFDPTTKVLWKDGIIYFDKTPLKECFQTLEKWYGVEIVIQGQPAIEALKVSGRFDNDYLTNVLNSISYAHSFTYEVSPKRVYITF